MRKAAKGWPFSAIHSRMRNLARDLGVLCIVGLVALAPLAHAGDGVRKKVEAKTSEAMDAYDLLEYEEAKKGLSAALLLAKRKGLGKDKVVAKIHIHLAIVYFSGFQDEEAARLEFANAIEIDSAVKVPKAYRTRELLRAFEEIRSDLGGSSGVDVPDVEPTSADCNAVEDIDHELVETAPAASPQPVEVTVSPELNPAKVALYYREDGKEKFEQLTMGRRGQCSYKSSIPASAVRGEVVHYYVSVLNKRGKIVAKSGSKGSPNIIEVTAPIVTSEDPLDGGGSGGSVSSSLEGRTGKKLFISMTIGSGGGFVSGTTEATDVEVATGFAPALFHLMPEVGYYFSTKTSISAAFRLGFPVIANVPGHATAAPSGLLRLRHGFADDGTGFQLSGAIGGGILRHAVKIENAAVGQDTDTTATGPLLVGAGLGYIKALGGSLRFVFEASGLVGLPVVDQLGCPGNGCVEPNFGTQFDLNLGLMVAF